MFWVNKQKNIDTDLEKKKFEFLDQRLELSHDLDHMNRCNTSYTSTQVATVEKEIKRLDEIIMKVFK